MQAVDVPILRLLVDDVGSSDATAAIACTLTNPGHSEDRQQRQYSRDSKANQHNHQQRPGGSSRQLHSLLQRLA